MSVAKKNLQDFIQIIQGIDFKRDIEALVNYLVETDYFDAPAAKGYHDAVEGGLYRHSKYVYEALLKLNEMVGNLYEKETLFFIGFGHDICKANIYYPKEQWHKEKNEKTGRQEWVSTPGYEIKDPFPIGHGEKSVILLNKVIDLTLEEMLSIRWHMGSFEHGTIVDPMIRYAFEEAQYITPLVRLTHCADLMAVTMTQIFNGEDK